MRRAATGLGRRGLGLALALACAASGCGKPAESIVEASAGREASKATIDQDPLALLPAGAIGYLHVDLKKLLASAFGARLRESAAKRVPLPPSAGFELGRDLEALYVGSYSMQGLDVVGVAIGTFDVVKIEQAASSTEKTPLGTPLQRTTYAGRALYTSSAVGFSVLTPKTALVGNETGIRRALDRIKEGRVRRALEPWMSELLETPNVAFAGGADLHSASLPARVNAQLPFLQGMRAVRAVGNFQPPGINVAGTASYDDEQAAVSASESLRRVHETVAQFAWILRTFLGTDQPLKRVDANPVQRDMQFVIEIDGEAVNNLLLKLQDFSALNAGAAPSQAAPATP